MTQEEINTLKETVISVLKTIYDPEIPIDIWTLHLIYGVEVDEEGTKAAAATAVIVDAGAAMPPEDFVHFTADHPFEFVLYHKASGTILFSGQYLGK